jgi:hypothetical protein
MDAAGDTSVEVSGKGNGQRKNGASGSIIKPDIFALVRTGHFNFGLTIPIGSGLSPKFLYSSKTNANSI